MPQISASLREQAETLDEMNSVADEMRTNFPWLKADNEDGRMAITYEPISLSYRMHMSCAFCQPKLEAFEVRPSEQELEASRTKRLRGVNLFSTMLREYMARHRHQDRMPNPGIPLEQARMELLSHLARHGFTYADPSIGIRDITPNKDGFLTAVCSCGERVGVAVDVPWEAACGPAGEQIVSGGSSRAPCCLDTRTRLYFWSFGYVSVEGLNVVVRRQVGGSEALGGFEATEMSEVTASEAILSNLSFLWAQDLPILWAKRPRTDEQNRSQSGLTPQRCWWAPAWALDFVERAPYTWTQRQEVVRRVVEEPSMLLALETLRRSERDIDDAYTAFLSVCGIL